MTTPNDSVLNAWRINARATVYLIEQIPPGLWRGAPPSSPRRSVGSVFAHLHNSRRLWVKCLAPGGQVQAPSLLGPGAARRDTAKALAASAAAVQALLESGLEHGGQFPGVSSAFFYGAMPRDVLLFVGYALSHEAHHRGQVLCMARELGHRLPPKAAGGLWQWSSRLKECRSKPTPRG